MICKFCPGCGAVSSWSPDLCPACLETERAAEARRKAELRAKGLKPGLDDGVPLKQFT